MKAARSNFQERVMAIQMDAKDMDKPLVDNRNGMTLGTTKQLCAQLGISVRTKNGMAILSAKRDGLQMIVERLHFCWINFSVIQ